MLRSVFKQPNKLILLYISLNLIVGLFIASDFGLSRDERYETQRTQIALNAYTFQSFPPDYEQADFLVPVHGTAQTMFAQLAANLLKPVTDLPPNTIQHYSYFLIFQLGVFSIFILAKHFINKWSAFSVALLFSLQPLFFGHAFINSKDIPLLSIFIAAVASGMVMVDTSISTSVQKELGRSPLLFKIKEWGNIEKIKKKQLILLGKITLALIIIYGLLRYAITQIVTLAYNADSSTSMGRLFSQLAEHADQVPVDSYINLGTSVLNTIWFWLLLALFSAILINLLEPTSRIKISEWLSWQKLNLIAFLKEINLQLPKKIVSTFSHKELIFAAILLGICMSTRVIGAAAGGIISLYFLIKGRHKAVPHLAAYLALSGLTAYMIWPYLWINPFQKFVAALTVYSSFPARGLILFDGAYIPPKELPSHFLIKLMSIQFTEPLVILSIIGFVVGIILVKKKHIDKTKFILITLWFLIPQIYMILQKPVVYHNFRQFLFITPPFFIFAGIALQEIGKKVNTNWVKVILTGAVLIPGIIGTIALHPYQYIYYNSFVGGPRGALRNYEMDYWETSLKEAVEYVNQTAPQNAKILVWGPLDIVNQYAREDLEILPNHQIDTAPTDTFDYAIIHNAQKIAVNLPDFEIVYTVDPEGALLVVVRKIK